MGPLFRHVVLPFVQPGRLAPLAQKAAEALKASKQTVAVFEATTAGLIQAALQAVPGASAYGTCGAVSYSSGKAAAVLGVEFSGASRPKPPDGAAYKESKNIWTQSLARGKRLEIGPTWCISESGACGPTFNYPDVTKGFTSIFVSGPVEKGLFVESPHNDRELNMWGYTKLALDLLEECVQEAASLSLKQPAEDAASQLFSAKEDRFGGVEVEVSESSATTSVAAFDGDLRRALVFWQAAGKQSIWLKIPLCSSSLVRVSSGQWFRISSCKARVRPAYQVVA
ncbi:unnamed protein product [Polarella glacialis]|uniref:CinA C-terminal domain-containing protein n=1 Tax=Polarella glacialis TaxID=89957 RepID=A0A813JEK2_POLGL|nr:unnamed protein product [Polarella glacialis]